MQKGYATHELPRLRCNVRKPGIVYGYNPREMLPVQNLSQSVGVLISLMCVTLQLVQTEQGYDSPRYQVLIPLVDVYDT